MKFSNWAIFIACAFVIALEGRGQTATTNIVGYQDIAAKVLGNVANNLSLPAWAATPDAPLGPRPPWGPRSFVGSGRLLNLSFRGFISSGAPTIVAGFVVGPGRRAVMIRAVGPSLMEFGFTDVLSDPRLELFDSVGRSVTVAVAWSETNEDTRKELRSAASTVGAFALREGSKDQVLLILLEPGAYTCVISSVEGKFGSILFETYDVPPAKVDES